MDRKFIIIKRFDYSKEIQDNPLYFDTLEQAVNELLTKNIDGNVYELVDWKVIKK